MRAWTQRPQQRETPASPIKRPLSAPIHSQSESPFTPLSSGVNFASIPILPPASGGPPALIQPFSDRGSSDDSFEQEAHAVAAAIDSPGLGEGASRASVRRASAGSAGLRGVHPAISSSIDAVRGSGSSLSGEYRSGVERRLGVDLSGVRIHDDAQSDALNQQLNARAFTTGRDIFFRRGEYNLRSNFGRSILNHELTHVVQQCGQGPDGGIGAPSQPSIQRYIMQIGADDKLNSVTRILKNQFAQEQLEVLRKANPMPPLPKDAKLNSQQKQDLGLAHDAKLKEKVVDEEFLNIKAVFGQKNPNLFKPQMRKVKNENDEEELINVGPLAALPATEPVRIVAHGNIYGRVGGYSGLQLANVLINMGLSPQHIGGVKVHACLPASAWAEEVKQKDDKGKKKMVRILHQPHIVELQDSLSEQGIYETVQGFEHCLFPTNYGFQEVASRAYHLYTDVVQLVISKRQKTLTKGQLQIMQEVMGSNAKEEFLAQHVHDGAINWSSFGLALEGWMQANHLFFQNSRLRRASSVRLNNLPSLLDEEEN